MNRIINRVAADVLLALSLLIAPWPIFLLLALFLMLWFPRYFESIVCSVCFDLLYRPENALWSTTSWSMTVVITVAAFVIEILRNRLRFSPI